MKCLIVLGLVLATASAGLDPAFKEAMVEQFKEIGEMCVTQEGASMDDLAVLMQKQVPSSKAGQCLIACFNENFGVQNPDGTISKEGALKSIEMFKDMDATLYGNMKTVIERCGAEVVSDGNRCNTGLALAACGRKVATEIGLKEEDCIFM